MATTTIETFADAGTGFATLPLPRQLMILIMFSMSIAIGVLVALWAKEPNMVPLYAHLDGKEASEVMDALSKNGVQHKYDGVAGVLVPVGQVHEVRMKMASMGLPRGQGVGYELLDKPQGFGTSQFMESVRYRRSIEGELAKTISGLDAVRNARVHLGLPRQSSFIKKNNVSSASIMVDLYGGRVLDKMQVSGIVHVVSSSVAGLREEDITVIDQSGNLLNARGSSKQMLAAAEESSFVKQKEQDYVRKINELLEPLFGAHSVSAEVTAHFDFTYVEKTKEQIDQNRAKVLSESVINERRNASSPPEGIPGALSNQPPPLATAPEVQGGAVDEAGEAVAVESTDNNSDYREQATRNYAIGKIYTKEATGYGRLQRISVAVAVNHKIASYDNSGKASRIPLTDEELSLVDGLVKDAVGFNQERGDIVRVVNTPFVIAPPAPPEPPSMFSDPNELMRQPWFIPLVKHVLGAIFLLLVVFTILRPMIRILSELRPPAPPPMPVEEEQDEEPVALDLPSPDVVSQKRVEHVKQIAHNDTKKAAQVVMNWVGKEDE